MPTKRTTQAKTTKPTSKPYIPARPSVVAQAKRDVAARHADDDKKYSAVDVAHWCVTIGLAVLLIAAAAWY